MFPHTKKLYNKFEALKEKFMAKTADNIDILHETTDLIEKAAALRDAIITINASEQEQHYIKALCKQLDEFYAFMMDTLESKLQK